MPIEVTASAQTSECQGEPMSGSAADSQEHVPNHESAGDAEPAISRQVERFGAAWTVSLERAAPPPELRSFLDVSPESSRGLLLVELIRVDLEQRWQQQVGPQRVEDYIREFPELGGVDDLPDDVILDELRHRLAAGDMVDFDEVVGRFPEEGVGADPAAGPCRL